MQVASSASASPPGLLPHSAKLPNVRLMNAIPLRVIFPSQVVGPAREAIQAPCSGPPGREEEGSSAIRARPIGSARAMPAMPTRRSTTRDAVLAAVSRRIGTQAARRTTSPPMVVGRKLEANNPAKVMRRLSFRRTGTLAERSRMCQRRVTAQRDTRVIASAAHSRQVGMRPKAAPIWSQPCWRSSRMSSTRVSSVPPTRSHKPGSFLAPEGLIPAS